MGECPPANIWVVDDDRSPALRARPPRPALPATRSRVSTPSAPVPRSPAGNAGRPRPAVHRRAHARRRWPWPCSTPKARHPALPVVVMSAYTDLASTAGAFAAGAHEFCPSPSTSTTRSRSWRAPCRKRIRRKRRARRRRNRRRQSRDETPGRRSAADAGAVPAIPGGVAAAPLNVLITGETGTGKELVARAALANRQRARFVIALNTAAIPAELLELNCSATRQTARSLARRNAMSVG